MPFQYIDPIQTYIVDTYGVKLRFEEKSVDDESRVTRWINPVAPGLKEDKEKPAIHAQDFRGLTRKKLTDIPNDKLATRYARLTHQFTGADCPKQRLLQKLLVQCRRRPQLYSLDDSIHQSRHVWLYWPRLQHA